MAEKYTKYPSTSHVPWSPGIRPCDARSERILYGMFEFEGKEIVVTEKMDGENTTMYDDYIHARSINSRPHVSRDWIKRFHAGIKFMIPYHMRICGENVYAVHSIQYIDLPSYFIGFSIWDIGKCLSWDDTVKYFNKLGISYSNVLYRGQYNEKKLHEIEEKMDWSKTEGYVMRIADEFFLDDFPDVMAKYVRSNHVQTDTHWMDKKVVKNSLTTEF